MFQPLSLSRSVVTKGGWVDGSSRRLRSGLPAERKLKDTKAVPRAEFVLMIFCTNADAG